MHCCFPRPIAANGKSELSGKQLQRCAGNARGGAHDNTSDQRWLPMPSNLNNYTMGASNKAEHSVMTPLTTKRTNCSAEQGINISPRTKARNPIDQQQQDPANPRMFNA